MNITVHIERLVLDGSLVSPAEGPAVQAAVEAELARLLVADGLPAALASSRAHAEMPAAAIEAPFRGRVQDLGQRVAGAVHEGIRR